MKTTIFCLFCLMFSGELMAQDIFLYQDKSCIDRYEYRFSEKNIDVDYIAYVLHRTENEIIHLEIGVENTNSTLYLPGKLTSCNSIKWNKKLIQEINSGKTTLSIVRKEGKQYYTSPVSLASVLYTENGQLTMYGSGYEFNSSLNEPIGQINLGTAGTNTDVYFKGVFSYYDCPAFQFVRMSKVTGKSFTECTILPGIGIIEERTGVNTEEADENALKLKSIDQVDIETYLRTNGCDQALKIRSEVSSVDTKASAWEHKVTAEGEWVYQPEVEANHPVTQKGVPAVNPCTEVATAGTHIVQSGENLYSISRKYGLTVGQLREWNHLPNDVIRLCQRLTISAPVAPLVVDKKGTAAIAAKPAPALKKTVATNAKPTTTVPQLWKTNKGFHTVQKGETLTLLAKMYGYTVDRLIQMNDLKSTELKEGQILKINDCVCPADSSTPTEGVPATKTNTPSSYNTNPAGSRLKPTVRPADVPAEAPDTEIINSGSTTTVYRSDELTEKGIVVHYHTVAEGETLFTIARMYNTTVDILQLRNQLEPYEVLIVGQRLVVK